MPIVENDPWRQQYFEKVPCPDDVLIPTEDADCYRLFPEHRWIYNKLLIAETQGLSCGPHGITPTAFPVFSKPIYNMRGMGTGSAVFATRNDYERGQAPGHMWMALLDGEHVSTDAAVVDGEAKWWRHVSGKPLEDGMFDYWTVEADRRSDLEGYLGRWLGDNLRGYTGMVNFETIGGRIIEAHLRMADQWIDLYGRGWVEALVELYVHKRWRFDDGARPTGYSVVLFGAHGPHYSIDRDKADDVLNIPGVSSLQITFHADKPAELHAMPPGGFRLAIVNCWDLDAGLEARRQLALMFWSTHELQPKRKRRRSGTAA